MDLLDFNLQNGKQFPIDFEMIETPDAFIPGLLRLKTKNIEAPDRSFSRDIKIIYDGKSIFLNISQLGIVFRKKFRLAHGHFIEFPNPKRYNYFVGSIQVDGHYAANQGLVERPDSLKSGTETDLSESVPYLFDLKDGRLHPLVFPTVQRILEPYPELAELYSKDPNWKKESTMVFYIELLNELIETEKQ